MTLRCLPALLLLLVALVASSGSALAHATLVSAHPAQGAILARPPERLLLQFNEPVSVTAIRLVDAAGRTHADLTVDAQGPQVSVTPPADLPEGTQTVSYRIVSEDGHPVGGALTFSIGAAGPAQQLASPADLRPQVLWTLRFMFYLTVLGGIGATFFRAWVAPVGSQRVLLAVLLLGFLDLVASLGVQGLDLLDGPWRALMSPAPWEAAAVTSFGIMVGLATVALLCAAASLSEPRPSRLRALTAAAVGLAGTALASTGHAATAPPQWLMRPAVLIHVAAAILWAGALVPLLAATFRQADAALPAVKRFSALAIWTVPILVAAGVILAVVQVGTPSALVETTYGRLLCAKLLAVAGLLGLAMLNRLVLTGRAQRGQGGALTGLRWSIGAEIALMVVVAGLVAGWRFTPPPRNLVVEQAPLLHLHGEKVMVMVSLKPGRVGPNQLQLEVLDAGFVPFDSQEVTVTLAPADHSLEPLETKAVAEGEGMYRVDGLYVPQPGLWHLKVGTLVSDFERADLETDVAFNR